MGANLGIHFLGEAASHSQTVITRQPSLRSAAAASWSRSTLRRNFSFQNATRDFGVYANRQRLCRCQKQPCTKITVWCFGRTMSGRPGNWLECNRKRYPARCSVERTIFSGAVSRLRIRDIFQLRRSRVRRSTMRLYQPGCPVRWWAPSAAYAAARQRRRHP